MSDSTTSAFARADVALAEIVAIRRTAGHRALLTAFTGLDGGVATMRVLRAVSDLAAGGPPSVGALAERLAMEQPNASRAVEQAVGLGLLRKEPSSVDRRRTVLFLTEYGHRAVDALDARRREVHAELTRGWTREEVERLGELLTKLVESYRGMLDG